MQGGTLGQRLKAEMRNQRLSSRALASELRISRNRLNAILADKLLPDYFTMVLIRKVMHLTVEGAIDIFFGADPDEMPMECGIIISQPDSLTN